MPLERRDRRLRAALAAASHDHDIVLVDCPPSLNLLTLNGLCSAHGVIVPMQCEYFALEGLSDLVNTVRQVHANLNPQLAHIGLLRVMFDPRITLQQQVSEQLKAHFGDKVFDTVIPRNVRLAEAPSFGTPGRRLRPAVARRASLRRLRPRNGRPHRDVVARRRMTAAAAASVPRRFLVLPGWHGAGPDHWQARWEARHAMRRVEQSDWLWPRRGDWMARLDEALLEVDGAVAGAPAVLVAHGLGCHLVAAWAAHSALTGRVGAALLVAPPDTEVLEAPHYATWRPMVRRALPFASALVASVDDPRCGVESAQRLARDWGSDCIVAGAAGEHRRGLGTRRLAGRPCPARRAAARRRLRRGRRTRFRTDRHPGARRSADDMTTATKKPKGLGLGLEALLGPKVRDDAPSGARAQAPTTSLPVDRLRAGKYQPRTRMDEGSLYELAESIRSQGVMQPVLVRPVGGGDWEIIAGERRVRAARLAGLAEVPVLVRDVPDEAAAVMALIENIQREDLDPLEEARGLQRLTEEFGLTHERAAQAVGRSRSAASNLLRLLNLTEPVQQMLAAGDLEMGHARALLALDRAHQITAATEIAARKLSVREAERLVAAATGQQGRDRQPPASSSAQGRRGQGAELARLAAELSDLLTAPVDIRVKKRGATRRARRGRHRLRLARRAERPDRQAARRHRAADHRGPPVAPRRRCTGRAE